MNTQLTQIQKKAIGYLVKQDGWDQILLVLDKVVDIWSKEEVKADTEFETIWRLAQREAKCQALKEFFKMLEEEVLK